MIAVNDPGSTRLVYAMVIGLVVVGVALVLLGVWLVRQTRYDPPVLAPLERMGDDSWRKTDPATQRRILDEVRPEGAEPLATGTAPPTLDAEFEAADRPVPEFDDLRPGLSAVPVVPDPVVPDPPVGEAEMGEGAEVEEPVDVEEPVEVEEAADLEEPVHLEGPVEEADHVEEPVDAEEAVEPEEPVDAKAVEPEEPAAEVLEVEEPVDVVEPAETEASTDTADR